MKTWRRRVLAYNSKYNINFYQVLISMLLREDISRIYLYIVYQNLSSTRKLVEPIRKEID